MSPRHVFLFALFLVLFALFVSPPDGGISAQIEPPPASESVAETSPPLTFTLAGPTELVAAGSPVTLRGSIVNHSTNPLTIMQLDLPRHSAVTYVAAPGMAVESTTAGTLNLGDLPAGQTMPLSLTVQVSDSPANEQISLSFRLRTAGTNPADVEVTLSVDPQTIKESTLTVSEAPEEEPEPIRWELGYTPPAASAFTGASTYSYPIAVPPGIGGLTPNLSLHYNSRGIENLGKEEAMLISRGFGFGWSMPQAEIINGNALEMVDNNLEQWSACGPFDPTAFTLILNGATYRLQPQILSNGRHGTYTATGDPSLSIEYKIDPGLNNVTGEYWAVHTPDGTEYLFGKSEHAEQVIGRLHEWCSEPNLNGGQPRNQGNFAAHSWKLESITDVYGHQVRNIYGTSCSEDYYGDFCRRFDLDMEIGFIPESVYFSQPNDQGVNNFRTEGDVELYHIEYNFVGGTPQSVIQFGYFAINWDPLRRDTPPFFPVVGHWRPSQIVVYQNGQVNSAYTFTYDGDSDYNSTYDFSNDYWWLTSITSYGRDYNPVVGEGTALPKQEFFYQQDTNSCGWNPSNDPEVTCVPILTLVKNGYGAVTRFIYDRYHDGGFPHPGGTWFVVKHVLTWDGVHHPFEDGIGNETAASLLTYDRIDPTVPTDPPTLFIPCFDSEEDGCDNPAEEESNSLVGFNGVTLYVQEYNGLTWTTLSVSQEEFDIGLGQWGRYWLNGKTTWQRTFIPGTTVELTEEQFTWDLIGGTDAQLTRQDHFIYANGHTMHTYETFSYLNNEGDFGALYEKREYLVGGEVSPYRCTQHAYAHQTTGGVWLVNRPLRQTLYQGDCGGPKMAETLYRYDSPASPTDTSLDGKAALEYTLVWRGNPGINPDTSYVTSRQTYYGPGTNMGLPHQTISYSDYSNTTTFAASPQITTTVTSYSTWGLPTGTETSAADVPTLAQSVSYDTNFPWLPASMTDPNNATTSYQYDLFGRLTKVIRPGDDATNPTVSYSYWDNTSTAGVIFIEPLLIQTAYKGSNGIRQFYDGLGRLVQEQAPRSDTRYSSNSFGERDIITSYVYDARGLLTCQTMPYDVIPYIWSDPPESPHQNDNCASFAHTTTTYDTLGRVVKTTAPDGTMTSYHHYGLWLWGNDLVTYHDVIDANRHRTQQGYDAWGRLVQVDEISGNCINSYWIGEGFNCAPPFEEEWQAYATTHYHYNTRDQLIEVVDDAGNDTDMTYNALGQKLTMNDPDMGYWTYAYDAAGNLSSQVDARTNRLCFYYDNYNRLIDKLHDSDNNGCQSIDKQLAAYSYGTSAAAHNLGRLIEVEDDSGSHTFDYDYRGRVITETRTLTGAPAPYSMGYTYDSLDRATSMTYPNGEVVNTTYNNQGLPEYLSGTNTYVDAAQYNRMGQMKILDLGNNLKTYFGYNGYEAFGQHDQYDAQEATWGWETWYGNLWRICTAPDASTMCQAANKDATPTDQRLDLRYSFDAAGNVDAIRDHLNRTGSESQVESFVYDHRNRLLDASTNAIGVTQYESLFTYDELGNFLTRHDDYETNGWVDTAYYYHDPAHAHAVSSIQAWDENGYQQSGMTFHYDANGNQIANSDWNSTSNLLFDVENRLVQVAPTGTATCGGLIQEAEYGTVTGAFVKVDDPSTSAGRYVHVPNGTGNQTTPNEGQKITYCFHIATAGTYKLKGWVYAPTGADNSFFVKVNNTPTNGYLWDIPVNTGYTMNYLNVSLNLSAGTHTIAVYLREDGTRLDKLELELQGAHTANVTTYVYDANGQRMKTVEPSGKTVYYPFPGFQVEVEGSETTERVTYSLGGQTIALRQTGLTGKDDFNDGNANGWTAHSGSWSVVSNAYRQTDNTNMATNSSYPLPQSGSMTFEWQTTFNSGLVSGGLHFLGSEASSTNHGNSYMAWQTASHVRIYESVNNTLYQRASASLSASNWQTYSYKATYNPATGAIVLYRNNSQVLTWTDTTPLTSGSYIALRTDRSNVTFDNVQVTAQSGVLTYMHSDHLGSNRLLTNSTGGAVVGSTIRYYPFGHWRTVPTADLTDRGFTGHLHDMNVGLIYMNARWYSAGVARFLSPDTIVPDSANPQSFNRYSYVENNPLSFADPTGHCKGGGTVNQCLVDGGPGLADGTLYQGGGELGPERVDNPGMMLGCTFTLKTCHDDLRLKDFQENEWIEQREFGLLLEDVAHELRAGWTPGQLGENITNSDVELILRHSLDRLAGRGDYDTPFYNGHGLANGNNVCIETHGCYDRSEVNYFAQGMWSAAAGDNLESALALTDGWNQFNYGHPATAGELYWTEYGYRWYMDWSAGFNGGKGSVHNNVQ